MATTRLVRSSNNPLGRVFAPASSWPSSVKTVRYTSNGGVKVENNVCGNSEKKPKVAVRALPTTLEAAVRSVDWGRGLASLLANAINAMPMREMLVRLVLKPTHWKFHIQMFIENVILNCRFFAMFAVAGSLLGSILCFMEGSFLIVESYLQYFHSLLSKKLDQEHIIHLLIEAIDMFLVGTSMLIFGMGLYIMFVGSKTMKGGAPSLPRSNLFGLFHLKTLGLG
ncbi:hypothetical protein F3Y22_tig00003725pilonHSYRG00084 [Hibiscus syriacus]|uniref:Uncharacterized protein n=1 Tax=Hibiscus syriacus TaxID=106335 RepID=A0A6A3CL07_HIBSY|nr:uncharacterized protein LOC120183338 [Hibiscus syriacus]KAE8729204.1 hypothetical protein F3Y22_tig00003725pilonHSYRG00084 [Hibiscus syriacus]